jgi:hypothetical protein
MQKIEEVIAALENSTGPDHDLDADILEATGGCAHRETEYYCIEDGNDYDSGFTCKRCHKDTYGERVPAFTASIDATLGLLERVLPGWRIENLSEWDAEILRDQGPWMCDLVERRLEFFDRKSAKCSHAPTAALALVIATLRALSPKEQP